MIYSELYGAYYRAVAAILRAAVSRPVTPGEVRQIARREAFAESAPAIESALYGGRWRLLRPDGTTPIKAPPSPMMTELEKRWLKSVSLDPRVKLFDFDTAGLEDTEPLFTPEDIYVFDKYADGDPYDDAGYIERFRVILGALKSKTPLAVDIKTRHGASVRAVAMPRRLEYSEKDDKFRLYTSGCRYGRIINLGRVTWCAPYEGGRAFNPRVEVRDEMRTLVLEITDARRALDRAVLHFAHFEKEVIRLSGGKYRLTVSYSADDETELLIRTLSFGPFAKVIEPESFAELIKERLTAQKSCGI